MDKPKITAWMKPSCGWSNGVRAVLRKHGLEFEDKDIINNPANRWEMEQKSGQSLQPTLEINGTMLADISGEELEGWLLANSVVGANDAPVDVRSTAPAPTPSTRRCAPGHPCRSRAEPDSSAKDFSKAAPVEWRGFLPPGRRHAAQRWPVPRPIPADAA